MEVVGQEVDIRTGVWMCDLLSVRGHLWPETKVEAFEIHLSDSAECPRTCSAFLAVDALDDR